MLQAVKQQINEWDENNVLAAHMRIGNVEKREKAGLKHLLWGTKRQKKSPKGILISAISNFVPKEIRTRNNWVTETEIDVIIDASGFAFSDQWGSTKIEIMAENCVRWKRQGKKIVLLPQAFGPFNDEKVRKAFIQLIDNVDLVFARDYKSYEYISQLDLPLDRVKVAPDFTNLLKPEEPEYISELIGRPCIVPNGRMLDKTSEQASQAYLPFLETTLSYLEEKNLNPFILIHELNDIEIGEILQNRLGNKFQIVQDNNPLILKGILNNCSFTIGSRFHGLISALSQGTPAIGTGWSHKYQMLFKDYDCPNMLVSPTDASSKEYLEKLDSLIDEQKRHVLIRKLITAGNRQKKLAKEMWAEVQQIAAN